jgi:hypothetical protein
LKPRPKKKEFIFILKLFGNYESNKNGYQLLGGGGGRDKIKNQDENSALKKKRGGRGKGSGK